MEFVRKKRRGFNQRTHKFWFSECGNYRITWSSEVQGVPVTPCYYACVRARRSIENDGVYWCFAGKRGPYRKLKAALEAAKKHRKLWELAIQIADGERKGRSDRLRALQVRAVVGNSVQKHRITSVIPVWAFDRMSDLLKGIFFPAKQQVIEDDEPSDKPILDDINLEVADDGDDEVVDEPEPVPVVQPKKPAKAAAKKPVAKVEPVKVPEPKKRSKRATGKKTSGAVSKAGKPGKTTGRTRKQTAKK